MTIKNKNYISTGARSSRRRASRGGLAPRPASSSNIKSTNKNNISQKKKKEEKEFDISPPNEFGIRFVDTIPSLKPEGIPEDTVPSKANNYLNLNLPIVPDNLLKPIWQKMKE